MAGNIGSAGFAEAHPGIDLRVSATMHHIDFVSGRGPMLRSGTGDGQIGAGLDAVRLCTEQAFSGLQVPS